MSDNRKRFQAIEKWFNQLSVEDQRVVALNCLEKLVYEEEVRYSEDRQVAYWYRYGEPLDVPF
ncbi:MAG: hypothetical protein E6Q97_13440 [Desulfurellales bacterium]|nr:MAG: hypothetical protein E6Q97_13440 [Desulfurellales bacterium]